MRGGGRNSFKFCFFDRHNQNSDLILNFRPAEVHVVLSREGGLISLGLASQETVTLKINNQHTPKFHQSLDADWGTQ
jgi:hypothetical protein